MCVWVCAVYVYIYILFTTVPIICGVYVFSVSRARWIIPQVVLFIKQLIHTHKTHRENAYRVHIHYTQQQTTNQKDNTHTHVQIMIKHTYVIKEKLVYIPKYMLKPAVYLIVIYTLHTIEYIPLYINMENEWS